MPTDGNERDNYDSEGYTNLQDDNRPAGKRWICKPRFGDFVEEFRWRVEATEPDAWPYSGPEPHPRPTTSSDRRATPKTRTRTLQ